MLKKNIKEWTDQSKKFQKIYKESVDIINRLVADGLLDGSEAKEGFHISVSLIMDIATKRGYVEGYEDCKNNKEPKITREEYDDYISGLKA